MMHNLPKSEDGPAVQGVSVQWGVTSPRGIGAHRNARFMLREQAVSVLTQMGRMRDDAFWEQIGVPTTLLQEGGAPTTVYQRPQDKALVVQQKVFSLN